MAATQSLLAISSMEASRPNAEPFGSTDSLCSPLTFKR